MFREETIVTGCKLNLFLFITGRRENGYHELSTLFVRIPEPHDTLIFRPSQGEAGFCVRCSEPGLDPLHNTLTRAAALYAEATGFAPAVEVELIKGIPHGAGLGGGSADAAEVLRWLQRFAPRPLNEDVLLNLAVHVGADVPFFLKDGPCFAEGIGEILHPAKPALENWWGLVLCPFVRVNTAWAYAAWDTENNAFFLTGERKADKNNRSSCQNFYGRNDFEAVVFAAYPELSALKTLLIQSGANIAGMSGSGSSLFGLFRDRTKAAHAAAIMGQEKSVRLVSGPFLF